MLTDRSNAMIAVNSILPSMAVFATVLRLYAKKLQNLPLQAHDYILMVALVNPNVFSLTSLL